MGKLREKEKTKNMENKKLKIVIILISSTMGGAEKRYTNLYNHLAKNCRNEYIFFVNKNVYDLLCKAGFQIYDKKKLFIFGYHIPPPKYYGLGKIDAWKNILKLPGNIFTLCAKVFNTIPGKFNDVLIRFQMNQKISKIKPDIVHGILHGVNILNRNNAKEILHVMSFVHPAGHVPEYQRNAFREADALDILNDDMKKILIKENIIDEKKMFLAPCSFTDYARTFSAKKEKHVVFLARMEVMKHPEIFIDMLNHIPEDVRASAKFIMIGKGTLMEVVKNMAKPFINEGILELKGYVSTPIDYLSKSLIFVQPTDCEIHGTQSLLEAMACGNAIITTDLPGIERIIDDDVGFRVPLDSRAFAEKVTFLLKNIDTAEKIGKNAREKVMKTQTVERYAIHVEEIYNKLVNV